MLSSFPGLHPLDASTLPPPSCDNQKCLQTLPSLLGGGLNNPLLKTTGLHNLSSVHLSIFLPHAVCSCFFVFSLARSLIQPSAVYQVPTALGAGLLSLV